MFLKSLKLSINSIFLIAAWLIYSCQGRVDRLPIYQAVSSQQVYSVKYTEWDSLELLVPQVGCSSCINSLIKQYQKQNIETKLSMIGVNSERNLRLNYGQNFINNNKVELHSGQIHEPIARECFERPAILLFKSDTIHYFCFKSDEVNDVISYLSNHE